VPAAWFCCYNDEVASAVMAALSDAGNAVPAMGSDDILLAQFSSPPRMTIAFDNQQFLDLLIDNILTASRGEPLREIPPAPPSVVPHASV